MRVQIEGYLLKLRNLYKEILGEPIVAKGLTLVMPSDLLQFGFSTIKLKTHPTPPYRPSPRWSLIGGCSPLEVESAGANSSLEVCRGGKGSLIRSNLLFSTWTGNSLNRPDWSGPDRSGPDRSGPDLGGGSL